MFVYKVSGCRFESSCSHLYVFNYTNSLVGLTSSVSRKITSVHFGWYYKLEKYTAKLSLDIKEGGRNNPYDLTLIFTSLI